MLGSALYYPFIDVRDQAWLRSAILFWDKIQTIVPTTITKPYLNADTQICEAEGYLQPLYCELHPEVLRDLGRRVIELFDRPGWLSDLLATGPESDPSIKALRRSETFRNQISDDFQLVGLYPEKMSREMKDAIVKVGLGRIHPAKMAAELRNEMQSDPQMSRIASGKMSLELKKLFGYREEYEGEWILVNSNFAAAYMAALAVMLAKKAHVSPLTSQEAFQGLNLRFLIDENSELVDENQASAALVTIVMESLRVDPSTPVAQMLAFRRSRVDQLAELSATFDDLRSKMEKSENQRELQERARRAYENKVRPGLEKLKNELRDQTIQSSWKGFYQAATLTATGGTLLANFAQTNSLSVFGAGLFLTTVNVAVEAAYARRKARASSPYTYLLDVENKFSLPRYS